jgi:hypothetical protein
MKKIKLALLALTAMLFGAMTFTACDQTFIAPENEWCEMEATVLNQDVTLDFYYTTEAKKIAVSNSKNVEIPAGFTVIVSTNVSVSGVNANPYYMKTFVSGEETTLSGDTADAADKKFTFKATMWDALYVANYKKQFAEHNVGDYPAVLKSGTSVDTFAALGDNFKNMSWKDIIIDVLNMF